MAQYVLLCSVPPTTSNNGVVSCPGAATVFDMEPLTIMTTEFNWSLVDPVELSQMFGFGFGVVLTLWATAYGAAAVLDVLRKS